MSRADKNSAAWMAKWSSSEFSVASTKVGQCVTTTRTLKRTSAGNGRASHRTARYSAGGRSSSLASHAGVPSSSSGGATRVISRCCVMWTL